jgi:hypothetical protein|tara:strand:+ start:499 stop:642 length:144 start_codon:yes stop_codon:yes gene_type:complete
MNNDVATLIWLVITNIATYNYCKWYFIRHTIDVLEEKGVLDLEDEQK